MKLASEKSMRMISKDIIGCDNLAAEETPLSEPLSLGVDAHVGGKHCAIYKEVEGRAGNAE